MQEEILIFFHNVIETHRKEFVNGKSSPAQEFLYNERMRSFSRALLEHISSNGKIIPAGF